MQMRGGQTAGLASSKMAACHARVTFQGEYEPGTVTYGQIPRSTVTGKLRMGVNFGAPITPAPG